MYVKLLPATINCHLLPSLILLSIKMPDGLLAILLYSGNVLRMPPTECVACNNAAPSTEQPLTNNPPLSARTSTQSQTKPRNKDEVVINIILNKWPENGNDVFIH